jgi:large subunit ribosomal protein L21
MYAIVDVKDKQFKVREGQRLYVPRHSDVEPDDTLTFDRVLLVSDGDGDVAIGTPTVDGASVEARVLDQVKGDKVLVFKKKRRKRYRVKRGHRQPYTQVQIEALHANGAVEPAEDEAPADEAAPAEDDAPTDEAEATEADTAEAEATEAETADADAEDADEPSAEADTAEENAEDDTDADADAEADTDAEDAEDTEEDADEDDTEDTK